MRLYKGPITVIGPNQIFVFGSNTEGRHGKGAALWAVQNAGAIRGQSTGFQGNSYAIVTKDLKANIHPSISQRNIIYQIKELYYSAKQNPNLEFLIVYMNKPNLNGYTPDQMAQMFMTKDYLIPENIVFEESFYQLILNNQ